MDKLTAGMAALLIALVGCREQDREARPAPRPALPADPTVDRGPVPAPAPAPAPTPAPVTRHTDDCTCPHGPDGSCPCTTAGGACKCTAEHSTLRRSNTRS